MLYLSRSAIETWQDCKRKFYYQQFYGPDSKGIVPVYRFVPLLTGTMVHTGVASLLRQVKKGEKPNLGLAILAAKTEYKLELQNRRLENVLSEDQQDTVDEQIALGQQLITAWAIREMPRLVEEYEVLMVEEDLQFPLIPNVQFMSKIDAVFQRKSDNGIIIYSLKTSKGGDAKIEDSLLIDLQGITETLGYELAVKDKNDARKTSIEYWKNWYFNGPKSEFTKEAANAEIKKLGPAYPKNAELVRYCILVKGPRVPPNGDWSSEQRVSKSPLIQGWRTETPSGIEYAHSNKTIRPETKTGYGYLGKGWEAFKVYHSDSGPGKAVGGLAGWMKKIRNKEIQPELGDLLNKVVYIPNERSITTSERESGLVQLQSEARDIQTRLEQFNTGVSIDAAFPQSKKSCTFPTRCSFYSACFRIHPDTNLLETDMYEPRTPHHEIEQEAQENDN